MPRIRPADNHVPRCCASESGCIRNDDWSEAAPRRYDFTCTSAPEKHDRILQRCLVHAVNVFSRESESLALHIPYPLRNQRRQPHPLIRRGCCFRKDSQCQCNCQCSKSLSEKSFVSHPVMVWCMFCLIMMSCMTLWRTSRKDNQMPQKWPHAIMRILLILHGFEHFVERFRHFVRQIWTFCKTEIKKVDRMARSTFSKLSVFRIWSEIGFRCAAYRAFPRIRDIFERCTRFYPAIGISLSRIINPSASEAFILHQIFWHNIIDY